MLRNPDEGDVPVDNINELMKRMHDHVSVTIKRRDAADDMYNALWEVVELSDRTLPPSGRTHECQRVYDLCRAALKKAEGE